MTFEILKISGREEFINQLIANIYNQLNTNKQKGLRPVFGCAELESKIEALRKQLYRSIPPGKDEATKSRADK